MSLFDQRPENEDRRSDPPSPPYRVRRFSDRKMETVVGEGVSFRGNIGGKTNLDVKGDVEGNCEIDGLVKISSTGSVVGDVTATDLVVEGRIDGNLVASGKMELRESAKIEGDVRASSMALAEGCFIQGQVDVSGGTGGESTTFKERRRPKTSAADGDREESDEATT